MIDPHEPPPGPPPLDPYGVRAMLGDCLAIVLLWIVLILVVACLVWISYNHTVLCSGGC